MKKKNSRQAVLALAMLACMGLAGCGQETETDPAAQGVLEITITPVVTPTPAPAEVDPDAECKHETARLWRLRPSSPSVTCRPRRLPQRRRLQSSRWGRQDKELMTKPFGGKSARFHRQSGR